MDLLEESDRSASMLVIEALRGLCEDRLRAAFTASWTSLTQSSWPDAATDAAARLQLLLPDLMLNRDQQKVVCRSVAEWDISLLVNVLTCKKFKTKHTAQQHQAFKLAQKARNTYAHMAVRSLDDSMLAARISDFEQAALGLGVLQDEIDAIQSPPVNSNIDIGISKRVQATSVARRFKENGNWEFKAKDYMQAAEEYEKGIIFVHLIPPRLASELYSNRALVHLELAQFEEAKANAEQAVKFDSTWAKPLFRLARANKGLHQYQDAVLNLKRALGVCLSEERSEIQALLDDVKIIAAELGRNEQYSLRYGGLDPKSDRDRREAGEGHAGRFIEGLPAPLRDSALEFQEQMHEPGHALCRRALQLERVEDRFRLLLQASKEYDNVEANYDLGICYLQGLGVTKDYSKAVQYFQNAAGAQVPDDLVTLKLMEKVRWRMPLHAKGLALKALGDCYHFGFGVTKDELRAFELWSQGAELGAGNALNEVGRCFWHGLHGVTADKTKAKDVFRHGATLSGKNLSTECMINLCDMHEQEGNLNKALIWAQAALENDDLRAEERVNKLKALLETMPNQMPPFLDTLFQILNTGGRRALRPPTELEDFSALCKAIPDSPFLQRLYGFAKTMNELAALVDSLSVQFTLAVSTGMPPPIRLLANSIHDYGNVLRQDSASLVNNFSRNLGSVLCGLADFVRSDYPTFLPELPALQLAWVRSSTYFGEHESLIAFLEKCVREYPNDVGFKRRLACVLAEKQSPLHDLERAMTLATKALSLTPERDDDWEKLGCLYELAAMHRLLQTDTNRSRSILFYERFVNAASPLGHYKVPLACYDLALYYKNDGNTQKGEAFFQMGELAEAKIPPFLISRDYPAQRALLNLRMARMPPIPAQSLGNVNGLHGGAVLACPRLSNEKDWKLASFEHSSLHDLRRERIARFRCIREEGKDLINPLSVAPLTSSLRTCDKFELLQPILLEEILASSKDQVFWGTSLKCVVVSSAVHCEGVSSYIIEDEERFPARLAIYNITDPLMEALTIGRVVVIANVYCNISGDTFSAWIRVDDPGTVLATNDKYELCSFCLKCQSNHKHCMRCSVAYCNKECQQKDWKELSHNLDCALRKQRM